MAKKEQTLGTFAALQAFKFCVKEVVPSVEQPASGFPAELATPAFEIGIQKMSIWATQSSLILLAGLVANVTHPDAPKARPSSSTDLMEAFQVCS